MSSRLRRERDRFLSGGTLHYQAPRSKGKEGSWFSGVLVSIPLPTASFLCQVHRNCSWKVAGRSGD